MAEKDPIVTLDKLIELLPKRVGDILWDTLTLGRDYLKALEPLKRRTVGMPYVRRPVQLQGNVIEAGLYAPPKWAEAHIGVGETTIKPQGHPFLALPTDNVEKFGNHPVGPKRYAGQTVIFGGIIWLKAGWGGKAMRSGLRQRRAAGEKVGKQTLIPLFILKGSVVLKKRIDPARVLDYLRPIYLEKLKESCLLDQL